MGHSPTTDRNIPKANAMGQSPFCMCVPVSATSSWLYSTTATVAEVARKELDLAKDLPGSTNLLPVCSVFSRVVE